MSKMMLDYKAEYGYANLGHDCEVATFQALTNNDANRLLNHVNSYVGLNNLAWLEGPKSLIIADLTKVFMDKGVGSKIKFALMTFEDENDAVEIIHLHKCLINCQPD